MDCIFCLWFWGIVIIQKKKKKIEIRLIFILYPRLQDLINQPQWLKHNKPKKERKLCLNHSQSDFDQTVFVLDIAPSFVSTEYSYRVKQSKKKKNRRQWMNNNNKKLKLTQTQNEIDSDADCLRICLDRIFNLRFSCAYLFIY